ncbi:unnamed protein product, partial [Adineta ricciae]
MASNTPSIQLSVRLAPLPASINSVKLAQELHLPRPLHISIQKDGSCAWINGFVYQEDADEFVRQWSGATIQGQIIECTVSSRRNEHTGPSQTVRKPLEADDGSLPNQQHGFERSTQPKPRFPAEKDQVSNIGTNVEAKNSPDRNPYIFRTQRPKTTTAIPSTTKLLKEKDDEQDRRPLCHWANKGECRYNSDTCKYRHEQCTNYKSCENRVCKLGHSKERTARVVQSSHERNLLRDRRDSCSSTSSNTSIQSTNTRTNMCRYEMKCFNIDCRFEHPDGWNPCVDGENCEDYDCTASHSFKRKTKCLSGGNCKNADCKFLHPKARAELCRFRAKCKLWTCQKLHPNTRARRCANKEKCTNLGCLCLHPLERSKLLCLLGAECREISCKLTHPNERSSICDQPDACPNFNCTRLHQPEWNPCEDGNDCKDSQCLKIHPSERKLNPQQTKSRNLKTLEQRFNDRKKASLTIFSHRETFCKRLEQEHVLIVTAETGSGKSTQLPQYAVEHFGSLVVCTQPRAVAALSLARRVAEEFDGQSVGESVGYQIGHGNRVAGSKIMFMTDAALIRESQRDPDLKHIRVLIIDEAHERSLNTDIVIGISKLLLAKRPDDFYVVIASATIDPSRFLQFFGRSTNTPLKVEGRVFKVTDAEKPPPSDCSDQKFIVSHVVPSVLELYPQHEGHTLVFLPGQSEIERAMKIFKSKLPDDCVTLPLYGSQSPEDQEKVIKFNELDKRMVVFCTNVAETSLTIANVRLVIDSGLAKEARYDAKRRLTVIETVRISRSSADQRKGRAGRTAPGHCVRLYGNSELTRANIEPEILRSSLDLVLLQLVRLNLDPKTFPFMDAPPLDVLNNSLALLAQLQCMDDQQTITKRGELFTELSLDPRLSSFIVDVYSQYKSLLGVVVAIVAILSAPGTIFFMGGDKEAAKARVALQAQNQKSDLIHLYSVYNDWENAGGRPNKGKCSKCDKISRYCICRIKYCNENGLNNKILQHISTSCGSIIKQLKNVRWLQPRDEMCTDMVKTLGYHLAKLFPEQCGYLLVPQLPSEGVRLISTDIRAKITNTSVFMQKLNKDSDREVYQHFVAMTITQLPSGNHIIERLHPISRSDVVVQSTIQDLCTIENCGPEFEKLFRQKLNSFQSESWAKWLVYQYDRSQCRFTISGTETIKSEFIPMVRHCQNEVQKKLYDHYDLLPCGPIRANFQSGLLCTHINKTTEALKMNLQNVSSQTPNELKDWLMKMAGIEWNEVKEYKFYTTKGETESKQISLVFKNEDVYRRAMNKIPRYHLTEQENQFRDNEKETWGRELTIQVPSNITTEDIIQQYG